MSDKKDKKPRVNRTEPKPLVTDAPAVSLVQKAKVRSLASQPTRQADYKPDYVKEAQYAHQIQLKTMPDPKPSTADLVSKGLMYAGDVVNRLGKSATKIEEAIETPAKRKPGRPKKQGAKDKEDEKLAMEVKDTKKAVKAVAKELEHHEEMSEEEHTPGEISSPRAPAKKARVARFAKGSAEAKAHMAKIRAARKKKEDK